MRLGLAVAVIRTPAIVIGVGSPHRRDDSVGLAVVGLLRDWELPGVTYAESDRGTLCLIELWQDAQTAVVVEGVRPPHGEPGRIHRLSAHHPAAAAPGSARAHGAHLGDAVALARALDRLPPRLLLYAVEIGDTRPGPGLSPEVADAAVTVADEIAGLLRTGVLARSGR
jgi:hydrogenase maturation protease